MKLKIIATGLTFTATTLMAATTVSAKDIEYSGDSRAAAICQAIVEDNPMEVKLQLRKAAREGRGVDFTRTNADSFQCNGQSLSEFADATGSPDALAYLSGDAPKTVAQQ